MTYVNKKERREDYIDADDYLGIDGKINEVVINLKMYTTNYLQ